jgi:hypothetical protein
MRAVGVLAVRYADDFVDRPREQARWKRMLRDLRTRGWASPQWLDRSTAIGGPRYRLAQH